jgi:hypothetical protein
VTAGMGLLPPALSPLHVGRAFQRQRSLGRSPLGDESRVGFPGKSRVDPQAASVKTAMGVPDPLRPGGVTAGSISRPGSSLDALIEAARLHMD